MDLDDDICYCYRVSLRKLVNFARRTRPQCPSQMTECLGAGTGCGWCIPYLMRIAQDPERFQHGDIQVQDYADQRKTYIQTKQPRNEF